MFGYDTFIVKKGRKYYSWTRGGMFLIGLHVYVKTKEQFDKEVKLCYEDELAMIDKKPDKHVWYSSLKRAISEGTGDIIFYCTAKNIYIFSEKTGKLKKEVFDPDRFTDLDRFTGDM